MKITIVWEGADGDEYVHPFLNAEWTTEEREGFVTVTGDSQVPRMNRRDRKHHYPVGRVLRVIETEPAEAVQS